MLRADPGIWIGVAAAAGRHHYAVDVSLALSEGPVVYPGWRYQIPRTRFTGEVGLPSCRLLLRWYTTLHHRLGCTTMASENHPS